MMGDIAASNNDIDRSLFIKIKARAFQVGYFRHMIFFPQSRCFKRLGRTKATMIAESANKQIYISHQLSQRHADLLGCLYARSRGEPNNEKDGSYKLYFNLMEVATSMGYKNPQGSTTEVRRLIHQLREVDYIEYNKDEGIEYGGKMFDDYYYDESQGTFALEINKKSALLLSQSVAMSCDPAISEAIAKIPASLPEIKALVRYMIASKAAPHGISLSVIYEKTRIGLQHTDKAKIERARRAFRKKLKDNQNLLAEFNLHYDHNEKKVYYKEQLREVQFYFSQKEETNQELKDSGSIIDTDTEIDLVGAFVLSKSDELLEIISIQKTDGALKVELVRTDDKSRAHIALNDATELKNWVEYSRKRMKDLRILHPKEEEEFTIEIAEEIILDIQEEKAESFVDKKLRYNGDLYTIIETEALGSEHLFCRMIDTDGKTYTISRVLTETLRKLLI